MLERLPPRRDPRVLLLDLRARPTTYAALDAWEVRGIGELPRRAASLALERLALQTRPSHVVLVRTSPPRPLGGLALALAALAARGLPIARLTSADLARLRACVPSVECLTETFHELRHLDLVGRRGDTLRLGHAVLAHYTLSPRHYAPRFTPRPTSRVAR